MIPQNTKYSIKEFDADISTIVSLLEKGEDQKSRELFNNQIFPKYKDIDHNNNQLPITKVILFFYDLDEYFNNEAANKFGIVEKQHLIDSYYNEYQDDLKLALEEEKK